jgi:hypothetical protein
MILNRDAILQADDLGRELVDVPEWGGSVYVRAMTGNERDAFEESILDMRSKGKDTRVVMANIRAKLCARCIVGEEGERLFTDADIDVLGAKSARALDRVFEAAQRLCGMRETDVAELAGN